jgi:hypothetical protein
MKVITGIFAGLLVLGLLCLSGSAAGQEDAGPNTSGSIGDIGPYNGPVGPDSPLYWAKIFIENLDESFTANETERVEKEMNHAQLRLSEVRRALDLNQTASAEQALNNYRLKMDLVNATLSRWSSDATGLLHAGEMIVRYQVVLEDLLAEHPDNTGLLRAYNNSLRLEERFTEKTRVQFQRTAERDNRTILKAIRLEQRELDRTGLPDVTATQTDDKEKGWEKERGTPAGNGTTVTDGDRQQGQGRPPDKSGNDDDGTRGRGTSRNT